MSDPHHISDCHRRAARQRGFTAVELVVSLSAGLIIAASAFSMARNATTFFKSEAAIGSAQFSAMLGISRLQADLKRAGFKSTPNIAADPRRCGDSATFPNGLKELAAIRITDGGSVLNNPADHALSTTNALSPDSLIIGGMYFGTEHYAIQRIVDSGGGGYVIDLQTNFNDGAYARTVANAATVDDAFAPVFTAGRFLRLVDFEGRTAWGVITSFSSAGVNPQVTIDASPALPLRATQATCGCPQPCKGGLVNPVVRMRYDLRTVDPLQYPQYAGLFDRSTHGLAAYHKGETEPQRTELVRVELDADGSEIDSSLEVLSEYAVDMKFGLTDVLPGVPAPAVTSYPIGDAQVYAIAGTIGGGGTPQRIRSVKVRFSTRAPRRDRDVAIPSPTSGGLLRFDLGTDRGFARMRTVTADVQLSNLNGVLW